MDLSFFFVVLCRRLWLGLKPANQGASIFPELLQQQQLVCCISQINTTQIMFLVFSRS